MGQCGGALPRHVESANSLRRHGLLWCGIMPFFCHGQFGVLQALTALSSHPWDERRKRRKTTAQNSWQVSPVDTTKP